MWSLPFLPIFPAAEETKLWNLVAEPLEEVAQMLRDEGAVTGKIFVIVGEGDESRIIMECVFQHQTMRPDTPRVEPAG